MERRNYREPRPTQQQPRTQVWTNRDRRRQHPADEPRERVTQPIRNNFRDQRDRRQDDRRDAGRDEVRRHAPIPPSDFARIKDDVYLVVRSVQMAHHVDLWTARNPVRALTDGVRRLVANIRPPRADDRIMNKLKEEGERFLDVIQVTMLKHLRDGMNEAEALLTRKEPPADADGDAIFKQAKALLQKNFGNKLTSTDVDIHLHDACTVLYIDDKEEERRPRYIATGDDHNLTKDQMTALRLLTARDDIIIRPADKGSSV